MIYKTDQIALRQLIGHTPLFILRPDPQAASIAIKLEGTNIGGSVKDRAAWGMLRYAEERGLLHDNTVIVEPTSGNTGIALAMLGQALGLKVILTMPESMSQERRSVLAAYGAELYLSPASEGMKGAIALAQRILTETPGAYMPDQFSNPGNPWAHSVTTAPEILSEMKGKSIAAFVAGIGSGGTITGTGTILKAVYPALQIIGVEPSGSPILSGGKAGAHKIQGIGAGFIPKTLKKEILTHVTTVEDQAALETTRWLAHHVGLFCGISTGANVWAAIQTAKKFGPDDIVVTIACDRGDKYLSTEAYKA
ncbi:MAG: cysteine synthase A [Aminobacterium sp.]|jgi:cysteine synthase A|uniref:cysteine synthase A n=1 Tax=Aminobacterium sp. TaxID=1872491 RepID=UPI001BD0421B|nr:cysteine synthase A [Aminobacterium sp.]MDD2206380.1 cysteine synthase A [Aminobacterium sp.]MDD3426496.1 cysteine synthase A [Aminobacterium sp.]MDD3707473.1 cysteine synthase A [Aminobacterium sp.]MDD4228397.1 cysteine synthase A [Aminobacterium sp.]MDD4552293.1 cysteine synthase A [Aminobacterium sp.]